MRRGLLPLIVVIQAMVWATHAFIYETWTFAPEHGAGFTVNMVFAVLSVSFVASSVLAFRYTNPPVRTMYKISAAWMGLLSFFFFAAAAAWIVFGIARVIGFGVSFRSIVEPLFVLAAALGVAGLVNANWTRITRTIIHLDSLPEIWRGRRAAVVSDLHLGHVRGRGFLQRIVAMIMREKPDVIFIVGDLFDGTAIDAPRAAEPLRQLAATGGVYFVAGNHELFREDLGFVDAVAQAGVRVLSDEKVEVDGLQIVGVSYRTAVQRNRFAAALRDIAIDPRRASVLLNHAPNHPDVAEAAGVSLQVSGHTHLGQFVPWTWFARRVYRQFVYGLSRTGRLQVFTSCGAGTWGPPLRLGSNPEIVVIEFQ